MDQAFVKQVEHAIGLIRNEELTELGESELAGRLDVLLTSRDELLAARETKPAPSYVGDVLMRLIKEAVKDMRPPGEKDPNALSWRHYLFLLHHVVFGQSVEEMPEKAELSFSRSSLFTLRQPAIDLLAVKLWHENEEAKKPIKHNLPRLRYSHFVPRTDPKGRDYVDFIIDQLTYARSWVLTVDGSAGVGKTTIVRETCERLLKLSPFKAIIWTTAQHRSFRPPDALIEATDYVTSLDGILDTIGNTLERRDIKEASDHETKLREVHKLFSSLNCLLVVDNLESLSRDAQDRIFAFLLNDLPRPSKALVAGREGGYPGQTEITVLSMGLDEARDFMRQEAESRGVPPLSETDALRVYEATQGIPLAMQQAIGLIRTWGLDVEKATALGELHSRMLEYMYEEAYGKLGDNEKKILHVLSLFREPASTEAIGAASSTLSGLLTVGLGRLYRAFLVQRNDSGRYDILPFTREFVNSLQQRDRQTIAGMPLLNFMAVARRDLGQYYVQALQARNLDERMLFLREERRNILELMEWCQETSEHRLLVDLMNLIGLPLGVLGYWAVRRTWVQRAIEACEVIGCPDLAEWFKVHDLAWADIQTGQIEEGERIIHEALYIAQQRGYRRVEALALRNLGRLASERGYLEDGVAYVSKALTLWQELGDPEWVARTARSLGWLKYLQGNQEKAREYLEESLRSHRESGSLDGVIGTLSELALVLAELGKVEEALNLSAQALALGERIEQPAPPYAYALLLRAQLGERLGEDIEPQRRRAEEALNIYQKAGARYYTGKARRWLEEHPMAYPNT